MNNIIVFTNGHGEDAIAYSLIKELRRHVKNIGVFPLVGTGRFFLKKGIKVYYKGKELPSGGLSLREGFRSFLNDVRSGLISEPFHIVSSITKIVKDNSISIIVGDLYPVFLLYISGKRDSYLILTSRSARIGDFSNLEYFLLKKATQKIFVRDPETFYLLKKRGIEAIYLGNPVIGDVREKKGKKLKKRGILFLPGSRKDIVRNISNMLKIIDEVVTLGRGNSFDFYFHLSSLTHFSDFPHIFNNKWRFILHNDLPVKGSLYNMETNVEIPFYTNIFADVLSRSHVVVGLSGTANEQSVALGKPVIAFPLPKTHATPERFTKRQKPLLRENLIYFPYFDEKEIAKRIIKVAFDKEYLKFLSIKGKETVGKNGIILIVKYILRSI